MKLVMDVPKVSRPQSFKDGGINEISLWKKWKWEKLLLYERN